jgi:hypothetical protein
VIIRGVDMICAGRIRSGLAWAIIFLPSLLLRTSTSALLGIGAAEARNAWAILFFLPLCCCALLLLRFPILVLPRQGMPKKRDAKLRDAIHRDANTRDVKSGLPKLGLTNPRLSKTLLPSFAPHDFRGNLVSTLDEPCFASGCRGAFMARVAFGTPNSHNNSSFRT